MAAPVTNGIEVNDTAVNATSQNAILAATVTLYALRLDNSANSAVTYFKIWDNTAPTVGTTAPDKVFKVPASKIVHVIFYEDRPTFSVGFSWAAVTTPGTAGVTGPTSAFAVKATISN